VSEVVKDATTETFPPQANVATPASWCAMLDAALCEREDASA
jgi:hypothetical protein